MNEKDLEDFNRSYEDTIKSIKLPQRLVDDYKIADCLRESEIKNILLLEKEDGTRWILKVYTSEYTSLLENEYQIIKQLGKLHHCPVPKPKDFWHDEKHAYLLREYIAGESLYSMYEEGENGRCETILQLAMELCSVIEKLHDANPPIIHRDIKPENFIWNQKDERLYLIDCDSARFYKEGQERDTFFLGTPTHAAPEAYGYAQCDVRSDVFGIGKTVLYLCCGRTDDKAVVECDIPQGLLGIIKKCIAFSPADRYSKVKYIYRDLSKLYDRKYKGSSASHKMKYRAAMLAVALFAFSLGVAFSFGVVFDRSVLIKSSSRVAQSGTDSAPAADQEELSFASEDPDQSLAEAADRISINVLRYRTYVDRIVTGYYEMDLEGMGKACDELFAEMYAAEDLRAIEWTDLSKLDEMPENFPYRTYPNRLCDPLAYYDCILSTKIGHFEDYAGLLYNFMDFYLNEETGMPDHAFYKYCNGDATAREENYKEALYDTVCSVTRAVMDHDGLEMLDL